ncbi:papilin-like [Etheostoma cragini]|uniref:papilin-like n=1 Tax=Etheostoma cragini TaxID=417921 RepID=UPI00155E1369|nr:papilin-like [Etheostoma cragini]
MMKTMQRVPLLLCLLLSSGPALALALDCAWDPDVDPDQALDPESMVSMLLPGPDAVEGSDPQRCREACCETAGCDLALLGLPMDGPPQCMLVQCVRQGRNMCGFQPSTQFKMYRKKVPTAAGAENQEAGEQVRVLPLGTTGESNQTHILVIVVPSDTETWSPECKKPKFGFNKVVSLPAVKVLPSSKKDEDEVSAEYQDSCMVPSAPGPCRAAFTMFYYDANTDSCQTFMYGGCQGNNNRYGSLEECMSRCSRDASFEFHGKPRKHLTTAVFLFVTLAAVSALLLAALAVLTLRRHRLSGSPSAASDKEELLPEDDHSSLESLSVPGSPKLDNA